MRTKTMWAVGAMLVAAGCERAPAQPPGSAHPQYEITATVKDLMDSMVDPQADVVWDAVSTIVTPAGTQEKMPRTDEEWKQVRRGAMTLIEATNLLRMPGRRIARPGEKSDNPKIELEPEQIQELLDKDRDKWNTLAHGLHVAATEALTAIDSKDTQALLLAGDKMEMACESCHLKYWYPNQVIPPVPSN